MLDDNYELMVINVFIVEGWGGFVVVNFLGCAVVRGENEIRLRNDEVVNVVNVFVC